MRKRIPGTTHEMDRKGIIYRTEPSGGGFAGEAYAVRFGGGCPLFSEVWVHGEKRHINLEETYEELYGVPLFDGQPDSEARISRGRELRAHILEHNQRTRMLAQKPIDTTSQHYIVRREASDRKAAIRRHNAVKNFMRRNRAKASFDSEYNRLKPHVPGFTFADPEVNPFPL